jgi:hypothetical protein
MAFHTYVSSGGMVAVVQTSSLTPLTWRTRHYHDVCVEGLTETTKNLRIASLQAKIWTPLEYGAGVNYDFRSGGHSVTYNAGTRRPKKWRTVVCSTIQCIPSQLNLHSPSTLSSLFSVSSCMTNIYKLMWLLKMNAFKNAARESCYMTC